MPGTADGLGSIGESGRPMLALARRETPHTARRERTTDGLMAPPCEVALPTLEKVPTEQRFSADDGDVIGLAEILVKSDIAVVEDWKERKRRNQILITNSSAMDSRPWRGVNPAPLRSGPHSKRISSLCEATRHQAWPEPITGHSSVSHPLRVSRLCGLTPSNGNGSAERPANERLRSATLPH